MSEGWTGPEEAVCGYDGVAFRTNALMHSSVGQYVLFNAFGDVIYCRHLKAGDGNLTRVVCERSNNRANLDRFAHEEPSEVAAQAFLSALVANDDFESHLINGGSPDIALGAVSFLMLENGRFLASIGGSTLFDDGEAPSHFDDLGFDLAELREKLQGNRRAFLAHRTSHGSLSAIDAFKIQLSDRMTNVIVLRFLNLSELLTAEKVRAKYPQMTDREAQVVASLALGNTIKGAASDMNRSPGTLSIQARNAVLKSESDTLQALLPEVLLHSLVVGHR